MPAHQNAGEALGSGADLARAAASIEVEPPAMASIAVHVKKAKHSIREKSVYLFMVFYRETAKASQLHFLQKYGVDARDATQSIFFINPPNCFPHDFQSKTQVL